MGKKVKAKPRTPRKAQETSDVGPGDSASQDASHSVEEATASASGREHCGHYSRDSAHLDDVLLEILSSKHVASCEHCREDAPRKKGGAGGKEKGGKQKKKGGASKGAAAKAQAKAEKSDIWVCLDCGRHFCGGAVEDTKPYGHARRHAKQDRHWWAARYDDPTVAYCLSCEKEVPIEMPKLETVVTTAVDDSTEGGQIWESKDAAHGPLYPQDDALPKDQILGSEHSGENTDDAASSLQPVILLPYKEFGTGSNETDEVLENSQNSECSVPPPVISRVETSSQPADGGEVEQDDYVGFGDMFNEPEVTSGVNKEAGKAEDIDVMAWSSNSADDEVDDRNAPVSVEGCLALYTEPEVLSEPWLCEECTNAARLKTNKTKNVVEMMNGSNEIKDGEEMMAGGGGRQDGEKLVMSCSKEDIDQVMTTDGSKKDIDDCCDKVHSDMHLKEGGCADPAFSDPEQNCNGNFVDTENTIQRTGAVFTIDKTEQSNSQTDHKEQCVDLRRLELESSSLNKQQHNSDIQYNEGRDVNITAEATSAPLNCDSDSVSCSATKNLEAEHVGGAEEVVLSSLPSGAQKNLQNAKDNEDVITRNQGRRKRMKMVGKAQQVQDNQNKKKEDETKVFRAAMRRILISKAPPVLTINLNRFSQDSHGRYKKLKGHVRFKEMLDIQPFMDPRCKENNNTTYRLVSVVEHMGTMTGGHYVAYVRAAKIGGRQQQNRGSQSWFYASDGHVRETSLEDVLNCEAYILFYERVGD
nr:unnamed protein product [Digitaria exilis]